MSSLYKERTFKEYIINIENFQNVVTGVTDFFNKNFPLDIIEYDGSEYSIEPSCCQDGRLRT